MRFEVQSRVDVRQGAATLSEALRLAERLGELPLQAYCRNSLGVRQQDLGDLDAAEACLTRALAIKRATGEHVRLQAPTPANLGRLACQRGDLRAAIQRWEEVLELRRDAPPRESLGTWGNLLEIKPMVGDLDGIEGLFGHAERQAADLD
ncbi:tetratricopeptide repeat protein [Flindersiella endophytica]